MSWLLGAVSCSSSLSGRWTEVDFSSTSLSQLSESPHSAPHSLASQRKTRSAVEQARHKGGTLCPSIREAPGAVTGERQGGEVGGSASPSGADRVASC